MIELKGAVKIAIDFVNSAYDVRGSPSLEEIELSDDKRYWYATLGFWSELDRFVDGAYKKRKVIKIDADSGTVESAKDKY